MSTLLDFVPITCPYRPQLQHVVARCRIAPCNRPLPRTRRAFCSASCSDAIRVELPRQHIWSRARFAALDRDGHRCRRCSSPVRLEVHHVSPARGLHNAISCVHHLDNLETLCHDCHGAITNANALARTYGCEVEVQA